MRPTVEVVGDKTVIAELQATGAQAVDLSGFWPTAIGMLTQFARDQYETDGGEGEDRWPELAASTHERKQSSGADNGILRETMETMFELTNEGSLAGYADMSADALALDGVTEQFVIQETNEGRGHVPRRHIFDFTQATANEFGDAMMVWVMSAYGPQRRVYRNAAGRFEKAPTA